MKRREDWFESQLDLDPSRLVFIDETWASTNMARKNGRAPKGERLRASVPHGHWKTTTFVAGLRLSGLTAPMVLDGPINGVWFQAYVDQVLVPTLRKGDIVVMDMYGRPRRSKKNLSTGAAHSRVLTCIRPLMRRVHAAGPHGSSRIRSKTIWRARGAHPSSGFSDPVSATVAPYLPFDLPTPPTTSQSRSLMRS